MKKTLVLIAALVFSVSAASAPNWFKGTLEEAFARAKVQNKPLLLDFYQLGG